MSKKNDPEFTKLILDHVKLNEETGELTLIDLYANLCMNFGWKGGIIVVPYTHVVWLLKHGRWPRENYHIDHINDYPLDNRPVNLQELTEEENHKKRRGKRVYRSYGSGKYGYGIYIHHDKRDNRYYVTRNLSRGHGNGDLKGISKGLGGYDTSEEAEKRVAECIVEIEKFGLAHMPENATKGIKATTKNLEANKELVRNLRLEGKTIEQIKEITGLKTVYRLIKDIDVDKRKRS